MTWFRDFIYIPLGGSRGGELKTMRNLLIVWVASGLWHGAAWTYVVWGIYYCIWLIVERFVSRFVKPEKWLGTTLIQRARLYLGDCDLHHRRDHLPGANLWKRNGHVPEFRQFRAIVVRDVQGIGVAEL